MYRTIQVSSCVSVQGDLVESLPNGEAIIRDGGNVYRGRPVAALASATETAERALRAVARRDER
jgi:hypothetical protein